MSITPGFLGINEPNIIDKRADTNVVTRDAVVVHREVVSLGSADGATPERIAEITAANALKVDPSAVQSPVISTDAAGVNQQAITAAGDAKVTLDGEQVSIDGTIGFGHASADAFGRGRVSTPTSLFEVQFQYDLHPLIMSTAVTGSGSVTKTANESSVTLSTGGTASGASAILQSKQYLLYQPGKSQLILMTGDIGAIKSNVIHRLGYFDANNGVFFEQDGTDLKVVVRTNTSGSPVDTSVKQFNWNVDKLDGFGPSGVTLNTLTTQIFMIDFQWLGTGRVRFGFYIGDTEIICHEVFHANGVQVSPYMNTANLPIRYEIRNSGTAASPTTLKAICASVASEGGQEFAYGLNFAASNGISSISVSTRRPIISIRPKITLNSIINHGTIIPGVLEILASSGTVYWELVYNGTLTGASFSSVDANSIVEHDVAASAISGGIVISSGFSSGSNTIRGTSIRDLVGIIPLTLDISETIPDILTLVATAITGTVSTNAALRWEERR